MAFDYFVYELERAYRCLNPRDAEMQNITNIWAWHDDSYITEEESKKLYELNFILSRICRFPIFDNS